jgi:hypothetical protein
MAQAPRYLPRGFHPNARAMNTAPSSRLFKEIRFFLLSLAGCTAFFLLLSNLMGQPFTVSAYIEAMIVIVLVCYLLRFVFTVMRAMKENP